MSTEAPHALRASQAAIAGVAQREPARSVGPPPGASPDLAAFAKRPLGVSGDGQLDRPGWPPLLFWIFVAASRVVSAVARSGPN